MKKLNLAIIGLGLLSTAASAEIMSIKAKVISSDSLLRANSLQVPGGDGSVAGTIADGNDPVTAFGYGADVDFRIPEYGHVGTGIAYVNYPSDNQDPAYFDVIASAYGAVDVIRQPLFNIFVNAGVSYHYLNLEDTSIGSVNVEYDNLDLWNYDVGLGIEGSLAKNMSIGLQYQYTNTFQSEGVDLTSSGEGIEATNSRLRDIKLVKNEVFGTVGVQF